MVGAHEHLRRDGFAGEFVTDAAGVRNTHRMMEVVGEALGAHFTGRGLGYEDMLAMQRRLLPRSYATYPACWAISENLSNAMHIDMDASRSFAVWVSGKGHEGVSGSWWFLFPRHGVAIAVVHGTYYISWDGRAAPHCTACPCVGEGGSLISIFTGFPHDLMVMRERHLVCHSTLEE